MNVTDIYKRINAPDASINNIGTDKVVLRSVNENNINGIVCRDGILSIASSNKTNVIGGDIELGIPIDADLSITQNTTYNGSNIINNLTVDGCILTISQSSDLRILNGGAIHGKYSIMPVRAGDLEILGSIDLYII
jgi:hypothetical protein